MWVGGSTGSRRERQGTELDIWQTLFKTLVKFNAGTWRDVTHDLASSNLLQWQGFFFFGWWFCSLFDHQIWDVSFRRKMCVVQMHISTFVFCVFSVFFFHFYILLCTYMSKHTHTCVCVRTCAHTRTHTHTHTCWGPELSQYSTVLDHNDQFTSLFPNVK